MFTFQLNHLLNNYQTILESNLEAKIENMYYELKHTSNTKEEIVDRIISYEINNLLEDTKSVEGFSDHDKMHNLEVSLMDYALKFYSIDVYKYQLNCN